MPSPIIERLLALPEAERLRVLQGLPPRVLRALLHKWEIWARAAQLAPLGPWFCWLVLAGRGFGKTRTGAEWIDRLGRTMPKGRLFLVGETARDARDTMVEGESGLLAIQKPGHRIKYEPAKRRLTWLSTGAQAFIYAADEPDQIRGPQGHAAWVDELVKFRYQQEVWDNLEFSLRLGDAPQVCVTTTPRPTPLLRSLLADKQTVKSSGTTYENFANLAPTFIDRVVKKYEGTRTGRQELLAEILTDVEGALWTYAMIEACRVERKRVWDEANKRFDMGRIVVAVDPATKDLEGKHSDDGKNETGIVAVGKRDWEGEPTGFLLADKSGHYTPAEWAQEAIGLARAVGADCIVAEQNQGGAMVKHTIHTVNPNVRVKLVTATRGKHVRAEPIAALYEQHRFKHVGTFARLEDQLVATTQDGYTGPGSPDRMDAHVWGATELFPDRAGWAFHTTQ